MKYVAALALLALSFTAQASHHRGHVAERLANLGVQFEVVLYHLDRIETNCNLDTTSQREADVIRGYSNRMLTYIPSWQAQIDGIDLDKIRRQFSEPDASGPQSVVSIVAATLHHARGLIGECKKANNDIDGIVSRLVIAWSSSDQINWHIQDAIREEIYQDPEFICSGPGNHCE